MDQKDSVGLGAQAGLPSRCFQGLGRGTRSRPDIADIVSALCGSDRGLVRHELRAPCAQPLPSNMTVADVVEELRSVLFPGYFGPHEPDAESVKFQLGHSLHRIRRSLCEQIQRGICFGCRADRPVADCAEQAVDATDTFLELIPSLQEALIDDARAAYEGDPAARSVDEIIFCYPGLRAITDYRIAHALHELAVPILPRMITEYAHRATGIDIHPGADIGRGLFIDHGTGVVIGETCIVGKHVRIYQGVTLGAKSFPLDEGGNPMKGVARHPVIEDDVIIYAGATILGRIVVGKGSTIGGNVWLTRGVPAGSRVTQQQPRHEVFENGSGI